MTVTKRRFGFTSFVALFAVAALGVVAIRGLPRDRTPTVTTTGGEQLVTLLVTFTPNPRKKTVQILAAIGTAPAVPHERTTSPFVFETMVRPGTDVVLLADQSEAGYLSCKVRRGLTMLKFDDRDTFGGVECRTVT